MGNGVCQTTKLWPDHVSAEARSTSAFSCIWGRAQEVSNLGCTICANQLRDSRKYRTDSLEFSRATRFSDSGPLRLSKP